MSRINTNIGSLRALRNVQNAQGNLQTSIQRLSTGLQVNSGKDGPAALIASQGLALQATTIQTSIDNSNRANNVIATADSALGEVNGLLDQVRGLVQQGLNVGALSSDEIQANQSQIDAALSAINRISANTSFNGAKLIDGSKAFTTAISSTDAAKLSDYHVNQALFGTQSSISLNATVTSAATQGQLQYQGGALTNAATIEIGGVKGQQTINLGASSTLAQVSSAINNVSDATGVTATINSGLSFTQNAVANTFTTNTGVSNTDLTFTDARATTTLGANASLGGAINIVYAKAGNNTPLSVAVSTATNGDKTITVNLATGNTGTVTSTGNDVLNAIQQNAQSAALVNVSLASGSNGTGVLTSALSSTALTGGTDQGAINFTDARTAGAAGSVNVVFVNPGSNSSALSVATSVNSGTGNATITVSLATNASGGLTSTLSQVAAAIQANTTAAGLVTTTVSGSSSAVASAQASTALSQATGTLVLKSQDYGSAQFVQVNTLSGSFQTFKSDGVTQAARNSGTDIAVTINGQAAQGKGLQASLTTGSIDANLTFNAANNVANKTAVVTVTGGGSLFQIGQEATSSGQIGVGIDAITASRLGGTTGKLYQLGTGGGKSLLDLAASVSGSGPHVNASDLTGIISQASNQVSTLRARLGALQKNVIETNISSLGVALENVTQAKSQITDTDFAAETANLQKYQVLSQAGVSVLSIANQTPQQVLSLLR